MIGCTGPLSIWQQSKQQAKGKSPKAETVNQQIKILVQKIYKAETDLLKMAKAFEVEEIINKVQGKDNGVCRIVMQCINSASSKWKSWQVSTFKSRPCVSSTSWPK
jgi:hypothetical protein